jgi:hypothetical protein
MLAASVVDLCRWDFHKGRLGHYVFFDGVTLATWALFFAAILTILFAWRQITLQRRQSRLENLERIIEWYDDEKLREFRRRLAESRLDENECLRFLDVDTYNDADEVLDFFEHVAFLVRKRHLDLYDVWHSFHLWIAIYVSDFKELIEAAQLEDPGTFADLSWIYPKLKKMEKKNKGSGLDRTPEQIARQYCYDVELSSSPFSKGRRIRKRLGQSSNSKK